MKQIYSEQLTTYLFNECSPEVATAIENELATNESLRKEMEELKKTILLLKQEKLSPSKRSMDHILRTLSEEKTEVFT